jgi:hypothetical protein
LGRRVSVVAVVLAIGLLVGAENASACSCVPIPVSEQMKRADGAFNGRLLRVNPSEGTVDAAFRFRVGVVAKGPFRRGRVVTVWSLNSDAVCGLSQGLGRLYGLFVRRDEGRWISGSCATVSPKKMRRAARQGDLSGTGCPG